MKNAHKIIATGLVGLTIAATSAITFAGNGKHDASSQLINEATLTVDQAMSIALAEVPGRVSEAEIEKEDGKIIWEISVLDQQNQTYEFEIDANSGEVLEKELDD